MLNLLRPVVSSVLASALILFAAQEKKPQVKLPDLKTPHVQQNPGKNGTGDKPETPSGKPSDGDVIKVTISTSLPVVTTGQSSYGVNGYLKNVSTSSVAVYSKETVLVVQPELTIAQDCVFAIYAFFPTEPDDTKDPRGARVIIRPKEGYPVSWSVSKNNTRNCYGDESKSQPGAIQDAAGTAPSAPTNTPGTTAPQQNTDAGYRCSWSLCDAVHWLRDAANFVPGNYAFTVSGKAYNVDEKDKPEEPEYHTYSETAILNVSVPQMVVIAFSGLGGLLAYLVIVFFPGSGELTQARKEAAFVIWKIPSSVVRRAFSAMLTSSLFTIVSSRLSAAESAFPIKVTVTDIWGAITFGFIAYFLGGKFINWLKKFSEGNPSDPNKPNPNKPDPNKPDPAKQGNGQPPAELHEESANNQPKPNQVEDIGRPD